MKASDTLRAMALQGFAKLRVCLGSGQTVGLKPTERDTAGLYLHFFDVDSAILHLNGALNELVRLRQKQIDEEGDSTVCIPISPSRLRVVKGGQ